MITGERLLSDLTMVGGNETKSGQERSELESSATKLQWVMVQAEPCQTCSNRVEERNPSIADGAATGNDKRGGGLSYRGRLCCWRLVDYMRASQSGWW